MSVIFVDNIIHWRNTARTNHFDHDDDDADNHNHYHHYHRHHHHHDHHHHCYVIRNCLKLVKLGAWDTRIQHFILAVGTVNFF